MNFLSPVVPIFGAMDGIVAGSLMLFAAMFVTGMFFGRAWCGWVCPMAALGDLCAKANGKAVNLRKLKVVRFIIFAVWAAVLVTGFVMAGGIKGADFLFLTETGVSVDMSLKYIMYYLVLAVFVVTNLLVGRRGACHSFCWMSPFLAGGYLVGKVIRLPQLRIKADADKCVECGKCSKACPMSLPVNAALTQGSIELSDCILCGECVKSCSKDVLRFGVRTAKKKTSMSHENAKSQNA
jgi:polyferredoxin